MPPAFFTPSHSSSNSFLTAGGAPCKAPGLRGACLAASAAATELRTSGFP